MNDEHRKARLNHLIATDYGKQAGFAKAADMSPSRVNQISGPTEPFGEAAARRLASHLGLPENWFNLTLPTPKELRQGVFYAPVDESAKLVSEFQLWQEEASPRSREVIDHLILLANKNILGDEDWDLIQLLAQRFHRVRKKD